MLFYFILFYFILFRFILIYFISFILFYYMLFYFISISKTYAHMMKIWLALSLTGLLMR